MKGKTLVWASALLVAVGSLATRARAAAIPTLFSTGVNSSGAVLAAGATDTHYTLTGPTGTPANPVVVTNPTGNGWIANTSTSAWTGPVTSGVSAVGSFTYTTTFSLTGFNPATAQITGNLAGDDSATVALNGNPSGSTGSFNAFTPFTFNSGFVAGTNTLTFSVPNTAGGSGLQVQLAGTATPEPSSAVVLGLAGMGLAARRRTRAR